MSALALSVTLTKSSVEPVENSLARIFSDPARQERAVMAAISPLPQSKPDDIVTGSIPPAFASAVAGASDRLTTTGQEVFSDPARPVSLTSEEAQALAMARRQQQQDEAAAKVALVAELAKGLLRRRLIAARETENGAGTETDGTMTVAALEPDTDDTDTGEASAETEAANADAPPEAAPIPSKRPDVPAWARTKTAETVETDKKRKSYPQLAYAAPEDPATTDDSGGGLFGGLAKVFSGNGGSGGLPGRGSGIAVYDIKSATVYMPDGQKLEAHSGLGRMKDNPNYTKRKNHGPTPPNVYKLVMRERLYHGVEAVRMLPTDRGAMHGRDGMLAHTSLVRGTNGSHGCVAFKNYSRFLKAFKAGRVKKMIVVPDLSELPVYMASL